MLHHDIDPFGDKERSQNRTPVPKGEIEKTTVKRRAYKLTDGTIEFDEQKAIYKQMVINEEARVCPRCKGTGIYDENKDPYFGMNGERRMPQRYPCTQCGETGYQIKKEIIKWETPKT